MKSRRSHPQDQYYALPGEIALTPAMRPVRIEEVRPGGRRRCVYLDREGGEVELSARLLRVTCAQLPRESTREQPM